MKISERIIVALDVDTADQALMLVHELGDSVGMYKVGPRLLTRAGPEALTRIIKKHRNAKFFYDAKFNDIPNTVAAAVAAVCELPSIEFVTVHANAGRAALQAAVHASQAVEILAVTALTSLSDDECLRLFGGSRNEIVLRFADEALNAGVSGVVCSAHELAILSAHDRFKKLKKVVPGIRPLWSKNDDQSAFCTPAAAIKNGADYIVVGRPITQPPSAIGGSVAAVHSIIREIELI